MACLGQVITMKALGDRKKTAPAPRAKAHATVGGKASTVGMTSMKPAGLSRIVSVAPSTGGGPTKGDGKYLVRVQPKSPGAAAATSGAGGGGGGGGMTRPVFGRQTSGDGNDQPASGAISPKAGDGSGPASPVLPTRGANGIASPLSGNEDAAVLVAPASGALSGSASPPLHPASGEPRSPSAASSAGGKLVIQVSSPGLEHTTLLRSPPAGGVGGSSGSAAPPLQSAQSSTGVASPRDVEVGTGGTVSGSAGGGGFGRTRNAF